MCLKHGEDINLHLRAESLVRGVQKVEVVWSSQIHSKQGRDVVH